MQLDPISKFFDPLRTLGVGFEPILKNLESATETITKASRAMGYPPFNIVKTDENKYVIEVALAGYGKQDVQIETEGNVLKISGKTEAETSDDSFVYKGIANRAFSRQITMADTIEVQNAEMINGMLKIFLENIIPESKKPRKVDIR
jgi:molecular chaperone IbpA